MRSRTPRRLWLALLMAVLAAALVLAACDGEDSDPIAPDEPAATATTAAPAPTFAAASPASLDSYRYTVTVVMSGEAIDLSGAPAGLDLSDEQFTITSSGEVVNPDRQHTSSQVDLGFLNLALETVRVGAEEWTREGTGGWAVATSDGPASEILGGADFSPTTLFEMGEGYSFEDLTARLEAHDFESETVNDIETRRYTFTDEEFYEVFQPDRSILPANLEATIAADLWLAEDLGVPVKMAISGDKPDGTRIIQIDMELTDLNGEFTIEPPA